MDENFDKQILMYNLEVFSLHMRLDWIKFKIVSFVVVISQHMHTFT